MSGVGRTGLLLRGERARRSRSLGVCRPVTTHIFTHGTPNQLDYHHHTTATTITTPSYDGPFTGRKELAGCGGGQPAISKLAATAATEDLAAGGWVAESSAVIGGGDGGSSSSSSDSSGATVVETRLPLGAWSVVRLGGAGGAADVAVEAGALLDGGARRQVARRAYRGGALTGASLAVERRQ